MILVNHVMFLAGILALSSACTYPSNLIGQWYSTSFGTLTFSNISFSGFTSAISVTPLTFTCYDVYMTQYVSRAVYSPFSGTNAYVYLCMNLYEVTPIKYFYTLDTDWDPTINVRAYTSQLSDLTRAQVCSFSDARTSGEYELLILKSNITDALILCPGDLQSAFNVTMTTTSTSNCNGSELDGQTSTSLLFNYSSCATPRFNSGGHLRCLYYVSNTVTYLTTYNNDTSVNSVTNFRFTCFAFYKSGAFLAATEHPKVCHTSQTTTSVNSSKYVIYNMTDLYYTGPVSEEKDNTTLIAVVVCVVVFIVIISIVVIVVYCKVCKKPRQQPETPEPPPPKVRKKKPKQAVTDYFIPPSLSRSLSKEDKGHIFKTSTEEILTGIAETADSKVKAENYQPPDREPWQTKWEKDMRPPTPNSARLSRTQGHSSTNTLLQLGVMDLENSTSASMSLPDNLDQDQEKAFPTPRKRLNESDKLKSKSMNILGSHIYSERRHAFASIPESTGKFGGPNSYRSTATVNTLSTLEPRLGTIAELSRENTTTSERRPSRSKDPVMRPSTPTSTMIGSVSTASAGDVFFEPFRHTSRLSHLSASNASIFDDPTWLHINTELENITFEVGKRLIPSLPDNQKKDQKWFLKTQQKSEVHREDIDPKQFKGRTRLVGLGQQNGTLTRSSSSLQIIQEEKRRRWTRLKKLNPKDWRFKWEFLMRPKSPFSSRFRRPRRIEPSRPKSAPSGLLCNQLSNTVATDKQLDNKDNINEDNNQKNISPPRRRRQRLRSKSVPNLKKSVFFLDTVLKKTFNTDDVYEGSDIKDVEMNLKVKSGEEINVESLSRDSETADTTTTGSSSSIPSTFSIESETCHQSSTDTDNKMNVRKRPHSSLAKRKSFDISSPLNGKSRERSDDKQMTEIHSQADSAISTTGSVMADDCSETSQGMWDCISIYSSKFYPSSWLINDNEEVEEMWRKGSVYFTYKRRRGKCKRLYLSGI